MSNSHTKIQRSIIAQAFEMGGAIPVGDGIKKSIYRIVISNDLTDRLFDILNNIRPGESKVERINTTRHYNYIDVKVGDEELALIKLSIETDAINWIRDEDPK